jgi:pyruvate/2-oxoglutarate/acetoin dehydrogenase E1 component
MATAAPMTMSLTMSEAINRALREALDRPEPFMLIGQDIGPYGGTFAVTRGLFEDYGEERIRDAPLCESGTVGYAIGLAITGVRAVCEIEFFDFVGVAMLRCPAGSGRRGRWSSASSATGRRAKASSSRR